MCLFLPGLTLNPGSSHNGRRHKPAHPNTPLTEPPNPPALPARPNPNQSASQGKQDHDRRGSKVPELQVKAQISKHGTKYTPIDLPPHATKAPTTTAPKPKHLTSSSTGKPKQDRHDQKNHAQTKAEVHQGPSTKANKIPQRDIKPPPNQPIASPLKPSVANNQGRPQRLAIPPTKAQIQSQGQHHRPSTQNPPTGKNADEIRKPDSKKKGQEYMPAIMETPEPKSTGILRRQRGQVRSARNTEVKDPQQHANTPYNKNDVANVQTNVKDAVVASANLRHYHCSECRVLVSIRGKAVFRGNCPVCYGCSCLHPVVVDRVGSCDDEGRGGGCGDGSGTARVGRGGGKDGGEGRERRAMVAVYVDV